MPEVIPDQLLFLDLRRERSDRPFPEHPGIIPVKPGTDSECALTSSLAALIAIDSAEGYNTWRERYHPLCPAEFPHIILLDAYDSDLAHRIMQDDAADCLALADKERLSLSVRRLKRDRERKNAAPPSPNKLHFRLQVAIDTLPSPIFIKDAEGRYIACNKAFEEYIGLARSDIVGATVYDVAPPELARIYDEADRNLLASGGTQTYEAHVRYADGSFRDVIFHKSVFLDSNGSVDGISGAILDITDRKQLEQQLAQAATTDFLTGIGNLRTFYDRGSQELQRFIRKGEALSLILIDIDHFKEINDRLGHATGDDALRRFVEVAGQGLRAQDIFARAGGDEFRLLMPGTDLDGAQQVAERIRREVNQLTLSNGRATLPFSISAGIARCQASDETLDDVCARADAALYRAKAGGRNRFAVEETEASSG